MKNLLLFILLLLQFTLPAQTIGSFTDSRDGQVYKTVTYKIKKEAKSTITWMSQNLNYAIEGSYCFNDSLSNCERYGRLYIWSAAKKCCPEGWHLPTNDEWNSLVNLYGGLRSAGTHLKSNSNLWFNGGKGSNKSFFNAMPYGSAGIGYGYFGFGERAIYWSASEKNKEYAWDWKLVSGWNKIQRWEEKKDRGLNSVRCVKD